jgi:hypothetical protein
MTRDLFKVGDLGDLSLDDAEVLLIDVFIDVIDDEYIGGWQIGLKR